MFYACTEHCSKWDAQCPVQISLGVRDCLGDMECEKVQLVAGYQVSVYSKLSNVQYKIVTNGKKQTLTPLILYRVPKPRVYIDLLFGQ